MIEDIKQYNGKKITDYSFSWGNTDNGIEKAVSFLQENFILPEITLLYYGNEFCEYRIPSIDELKKAYFFAKKEDLEFVFVTPVVTDYGISIIEQCIESLCEITENPFIVINDLGVLELIKTKYPMCIVFLGRIMDKLSHDIRATKEEFYSYYGHEGIIYASTPSVGSDGFMNALGYKMIERCELDLPAIGINLPKYQRFSLYYPYCYLTTGRVCSMRAHSLEKKEKYLVDTQSCNKLCKSIQIEKRKSLNGYQFMNGQRKNNQYLFQRGNTVFYVLENLDVKEIQQFDRIILQV